MIGILPVLIIQLTDEPASDDGNFRLQTF